MDIFSRYCGRVGGTTSTDFTGVELGFNATPRKTTYKNSKNLGAIQRSDQKLWTFSAGTVVALVLRPNGHRRRGVGIPHYSKENSLRKLL
jgi:hypothetical protein